MKRQIVNIINFIRAVEPRPGKDMDLIKPVQEQIKLLKKHQLKGTFLIQYDALINPAFTSMLTDLDSNQFELGVWLEVVEPLAVNTEIPWRGRYSWDWHAHCGFTVGYSLLDRERMIDTIMNDYFKVFHSYPKSIGSWSLDVHTISYLEDKYNIDAICICKDQWGTDGYNLWGGYYNQGYYPSRNNYFCPAQSLEQQIQIPVFRMLGSDPIHQYDFGMNPETGAIIHQPVISLEPIYIPGGGDPAWTDWYFRENFNGNCLSFGYTQVGQENSFGWEKMSEGLIYQIELLENLQKEGKLEVETLGETGQWYKNTYSTTPASVVAALSDSLDKGNQSIWYNSKYYRINLYTENNRFWVRDMHLFCEDYRERYLDEVCVGNQLQFDNLPIIDGYRWTGNQIRAGLYPMHKDQALTFESVMYKETEGHAEIRFTGTACGTVTFILTEEDCTIVMEQNANELSWIPQYDQKSQHLPRVVSSTPCELQLEYNHFTYTAVKLEQGTMDVNNYSISGEDNRIRFTFKQH